MIRRGVTLVLFVVLLSGCAAFGGPTVAEQQRPQVESDVLTATQLDNIKDLVTAESVRRLGEDDDGREYYVASGNTDICLIVVDGGAASACSSGLPLTLEVPGAYHAELWPDSAGSHEQIGHWLGEHLWLAENP